MIDLGREPLPSDVSLRTELGGLYTPVPLYVSAFGSTLAVSSGLGRELAAAAGALGIPLVIGENVVPVQGYGRLGAAAGSLLDRLRAYRDAAASHEWGGVVVQQSTEDADAEVWNLVYSDPTATDLLESGRLAFELKVGQGAKPGLGGQTLLGEPEAAAVGNRFVLDRSIGLGEDRMLRSGTPGTFTDEILRQQIHLMRNNYPRCGIWVKLPPARDVGSAVRVAWEAGVDAVGVDGAEAGTGWAPTSFLDHVGLPLYECLRRIDPVGCLLVSGRIWEGARAVKCLAAGASGLGLGRAALIAADEDADLGLRRLVDCIGLELRLLVSALGKYDVRQVSDEDLWPPLRNELATPCPDLSVALEEHP
jgi:hypothetical protein